MKNTTNKAKRRNQKIRKVVSPYRDQGYFQDLAGATAKKQTAMNTLGDRAKQTDIAYGMGKYGGDPTTNPYSQAALLQSNYQKQRRGTLNSMASGGQLYSGAHANARSANLGDYNKRRDSLVKDYNRQVADIAQGREQAAAEWGASKASAGQSAIGRAAQIRPVIGNYKKKKKKGKKNKGNRYSGGVRP